MKLTQSPGVIDRSAVAVASMIESQVRGRSLRITDLIFENAFSIGLRSGE